MVVVREGVKPLEVAKDFNLFARQFSLLGHLQQISCVVPSDYYEVHDYLVSVYFLLMIDHQLDFILNGI